MSHTEPASLDATHGCAEIHDDAQRVALAWRSLRRGTAARRMRALAWAPDPPQLDMGQIDSLDLLVRHRSWTMCEFATALGIDPSTATRAIGRLVDVGLAERHTSHADKRVTLVAATPLGRQTQRRVQPDDSTSSSKPSKPSTPMNATPSQTYLTDSSPASTKPSSGEPDRTRGAGNPSSTTRPTPPTDSDAAAVRLRRFGSVHHGEPVRAEQGLPGRATGVDRGAPRAERALKAGEPQARARASNQASGAQTDADVALAALRGCSNRAG